MPVEETTVLSSLSRVLHREEYTEASLADKTINEKHNYLVENTLQNTSNRKFVDGIIIRRPNSLDFKFSYYSRGEERSCTLHTTDG